MNQVMGDGIMALFGAPIAHEKTAVRALVALQHLPQSRTTMEQTIDVLCELRTALLPLNERKRIFDLLREAEALSQVLSDQRRLGRSPCLSLDLCG